MAEEHALGLAKAPEIPSLPGVGAIFIGPNELRSQMRKRDGTFPTPAEHEAAIQKVIEVGKKVGCPTGIHAMDPENGLERAKQGMQFLAVGSELRFMSQKAEETLAILHLNRSKKDVARY